MANLNETVYLVIENTYSDYCFNRTNKTYIKIFKTKECARKYVFYSYIDFIENEIKDMWWDEPCSDEDIGKYFGIDIKKNLYLKREEFKYPESYELVEKEIIPIISRGGIVPFTHTWKIMKQQILGE